MYQRYVDKLLSENPTWWTRYDSHKKIKRGHVYAKEGNKVVLKISWGFYREITCRFYHEAKAAIIQGETLNLGSYLGKLNAARVQRDFRKPTLDYGETMRLKILGPDNKFVKVYHTSDDYCRISWRKCRFRVKDTKIRYYPVQNVAYYRFTPSNENMINKKGFKAEFKKALHADPDLKYRYRYYPLRLNKREEPSSNRGHDVESDFIEQD